MKKFVALTILAVFCIPLASAIPLRGYPLWYGQYLAMLFFMFLGISFVLWHFNRWLSILTAVCLFSTFFIARLSPRAIVLLFQFDMACLAAYGISRFNQRQRKCVLWAILGITILQFAWVGLQYFNIDPIFNLLSNPQLDDMVGFSASPDQIGTFFALTFPVLLYFNPLLLVISFLGLTASKSSFAFVSAVVSGLFYFYFINKKWFAISAILLLILTMLFTVKFDKVTWFDWGGRLAVWRCAVESTVKGEILIEKNGKRLLIHTNPVVGYGFGNFLRIFPYVPQMRYEMPDKFGVWQFNYSGEKFTHAHNDYVEAFFELGYLGIVSLIMLMGSFVYGFIKSVKDKELVLYFSCIMAYLLNASGNFLSQIAVSGMLLTIFYGCYEGKRKELNCG